MLKINKSRNSIVSCVVYRNSDVEGRQDLKGLGVVACEERGLKWVVELVIHGF